MSTQADYTPEEWKVLVHAPLQASMLIVNADKSGGIQGTFGVIQESKDARASVEAHAANDTGFVHDIAQSLLDEKSWKPLVEGATPESITKSLSRADEIVSMKASQVEALAYKSYIMDVARRTASAAKESGPTQTSDKEKVALAQISGLLKYNG